MTLPSNLLNTNAAGYTLTCNTGCTAATVTASVSSNILKFQDVFSAEVAAGTMIDLSIAGWTNPSTETAMEVTFEVIWDATNDYQIDKFSNLGSLSSTQSIYNGLTSNFANTYIMITS